jgi:Lon protease-like protein
METHRIPLFPLGVVMLPWMQMPLHIFEERYKQMISTCLRDEIPFGIVLFDGQAIRPVGCLARITEVLQRYDDGRMDIMTVGGDRFVVRELIEEQDYLEARVLFFDDGEETNGDDLEAVIDKAMDLLKTMIDTELPFDPADLGGRIDPQQLAYAIGALEGFTPAERQGLLEMTSPSERLKKSVQALARIVSRNRLTQEIEQLIGGNGHPPKSILDELEDKIGK